VAASVYKLEMRLFLWSLHA